MAVQLARPRLLHCDPDHIAALRGLSAADRFTFVEVSVIVLNSALTERRTERTAVAPWRHRLHLPDKG
jgi:hypothetical protein